MMEHENERMNYSFESMDNSNGSEGYRQSSYDGSYRPNQDQDHNSNKKKNGIGGRMIALLVAVALVASIGGSALTSVINSISRKNEEANAKAAETMSSQTVEPAQDAQDGAQDTQSENGGYTLEKSTLPTSLSSNDTGKSLTPKEVYAMNVNACVGIATQITTNVWGQVASASASGSGFILTSDGYVVTNNHVVEGATSVTVKLYDGTEYDAQIVGTDEMNDVALLKIDATGLLGAAAFFHGPDHRAGRQTIGRSGRAVKILDRHTEIRSAGHMTVLLQIINHTQRVVDRNCKADALDARAGRRGAGVLCACDTNDVAVHVKQRAAGVAGVDCRIRLHHVDRRAVGIDAAVKCADVALRHRKS